VELFVDDASCHGELPGSTNNGMLTMLNRYAHHLKR
jgi:hypothetical protein